MFDALLDEFAPPLFEPEHPVSEPLTAEQWAAFERWEAEQYPPAPPLERMVFQAQEESRAAGAKIRAVSDFVRAEMGKVAGGPQGQVEFAARSAQVEVQLALRLSPQAASRLVELALAMSRRLPGTLAALEGGRVSVQVARMMVDETENLTEEQAAKVEEKILPRAEDRTAASLQKSTRREVLKLDADAGRKRREKAMRERDVKIFATQDGMACLSADLPLELGWEIKNLLNALAAHKTPDDTRSIGERRSDAFTDLLLRPDDDQPRTTAVLHLHAAAAAAGSAAGSAEVDACTCGAAPVAGAAAGAGVVGGLVVDEDLPATANGFTDPLDPRAALAAADELDLIVPPAGALAGLPFDIVQWLAELNSRPYVYKPSPQLARAVRLRDKHCRFPGCRMPANRCEIDHTIKFKLGGTTVTFNLSCLCKFHHRLKDEGDWICTQDLLGRLTWTSPNGLSYMTSPPPRFGDSPPDFQKPAPSSGPCPMEEMQQKYDPGPLPVPRSDKGLYCAAEPGMHGPWLPWPPGWDTGF